MHPRRRRIARGLPLAAGLLAAAAACAETEAAALKALAGAPARVVWCQDAGDGSDSGAVGERLRLMGLCTEDALGERTILPGLSNYARPLLSPDGQTVVFSNRREGRIYAVRWDGTGLRPVADGFALAVWADPRHGDLWLYAGTASTNETALRAIRRQRLDDPSVREPVWDRTPVDIDNFQLSADGRRSSGLIPWPVCARLELPNGAAHKLGSGCWPSLAPDNSYRAWLFDGAHRNLTLCEAPDGPRWTVPLDQAPGIGGYEVYHPRWSSHPRFLVMTGPYLVGEGGNRIRGGGRDVELHAGRFSPDFRRIESWACITRNRAGDFFPDLWITGGREAGVRTPAPAGSKPGGAPPAGAWPAVRADLVFAWENRSAENTVPGADGSLQNCRVEPAGLARFGRHFEMRTAGGAFVPEPGGAALLAACRRTFQLGLEALVTPLGPSNAVPGRILAWSAGGGACNVSLDWEAGRLRLRWREGPADLEAFDLGPAPVGRPRHVAVGYRAGRLCAYVDGEPVVEDRPVRVGGWGPHPLVFGRDSDGRAVWDGLLEAVALSARAMTAEEARRSHRGWAARLAARRPPPRLVVVARPAARPRVPDPASLAPYRRALVADRYTVERVEMGQFEGGDLLAAGWAVLDGEALPLDRESGGPRRLVLEPYDEHPELEGERLIAEGESWRWPLFYKVETPAE